MYVGGLLGPTGGGIVAPLLPELVDQSRPHWLSTQRTGPPPSRIY
jgi:hypothetical protein